MKLSKTLNKMFKKQLIVNKDHEKHKQYIAYRNIYNRLKRKAKQYHFEKLLSQNQNNLKKTWKVLITNRQN